MVNIKLGILEMVEKAREQIEEVDVEDAIAESKNSDCLIIDVRDVRERKRDGYIPESFHCKADWRSALTVQTVTSMGLENAAHIKGGLTAWCEAGGPFSKDEG